MSKHGKSYTNAQEKIDQSKEYNLPEAISLIKEVSYAKFDESIEVSVKLGVDPKHADQIVKGVVQLPHGTGKNIKIAEKICQSLDQQQAQEIFFATLRLRKETEMVVIVY